MRYSLNPIPGSVLTFCLFLFSAAANATEYNVYVQFADAPRQPNTLVGGEPDVCVTGPKHVAVSDNGYARIKLEVDLSAPYCGRSSFSIGYEGFYNNTPLMWLKVEFPVNDIPRVSASGNCYVAGTSITCHKLYD